MGVTLSLLTSSCVHPAKVSHELNIRHIPELRVILKSTLDRLPFDWAHAHIPVLPLAQQLAIMLVLKLDDLVDISRRRRGIIHR